MHMKRTGPMLAALAVVAAACGSSTSKAATTTAAPAATVAATVAVSTTASAVTSPGTVAATAAGTTTAAAPAAAITIKEGIFEGAVTYLTSQVANDQKFYAANGLTQQSINPQDGATMMRLLINGGDENFLIADGSSAITARNQKQSVVIVGSVINKTLYQVSGSTKLMASAGSGDLRAKLTALKGKVIGVPGIGGGAELTLRGLLKSGGLNPDSDVKLISITTITAAIAQLEQGTIDAYVYVAPAAALINKAGAGGLFIDIANEAPAAVSDAVVGPLSTEEYVKAHPDAVKQYLAAQEAALKWIEDPTNESAALTVIEKHMTNGDAVLAKTVLDGMRKLYATAKPGLAVPKDVLQHQLDLLTTGGLIKQDAVTTDQLIAATS